jgi:hypothetical protein
VYAISELNRLAAHKRAVRARIVIRRTESALAAARAAHPLVWLDRAVDLWHKFRPMAKFAAVPVVWGLERAFFTRRSRLGRLLRWSSLIAGALRRFSRTK